MKNKVTLKIGITGGIGSGKTIISRVFSVLGIPVYNADDRAKWLMENNLLVIEGIKSLFGKDAYLNGKINRTLISAKAFYNPELLEQLNGVVHPAVGMDYAEWHNTQTNVPYTLKEAALLFEAGSYKELEKTILVLSPQNLKIKRIMRRDPFRKEEEIKAIFERQMKDEDKQKMGDYFILNDDSHMIIPQVLKIHKELL